MMWTTMFVCLCACIVFFDLILVGCGWQGNTALYYAMKDNNVKIIELLFSHFNEHEIKVSLFSVCFLIFLFTTKEKESEMDGKLKKWLWAKQKGVWVEKAKWRQKFF